MQIIGKFMPMFDSVYAYLCRRLCLSSDSFMPIFFGKNREFASIFLIKKLYLSKKGANFVRCNKKY